MAAAQVSRTPRATTTRKTSPAKSAKQTATAPAKRRPLAGVNDRPDVPRLLFSVEEAAYALGVRKRTVEELIARGPDYGGIFSLKIGGRRLVPLWALEAYTRPPEAGAI